MRSYWANMRGIADIIVALGLQLKKDGYFFCTTTPTTHARVIERPNHEPNILRRVFGWNAPCLRNDLPSPYKSFLKIPEIFDCDAGEEVRAKVRFSTIESLLLAHSAFPTDEPDAVFFGPDTYRFARAIRALRDREPSFYPRSCVDIGAGTGAGGILCERLFPSLAQIELLDINSRVLCFAAANTALNNAVKVQVRISDVMSAFDGDADLIVSNPPYLVDTNHRTYREGGGQWGTDLSLRILAEALDQLSPTGRLLLYTGSPIVRGEDRFFAEAVSILRNRTVQYRYEEIDPDVFGEELDKWPYYQADRIATVLLDVKGSDLQR